MFGPYRSPLIIKTFAVTAATDNAIWTPTKGTKVRIIGFYIDVQGSSTLNAAGSQIMTLKDGSTGIFSASVRVNNAVQIAQYYQQAINWAESGYESGAVDNVINLTLSAAFTAGSARGAIWGFEEAKLGT